MEADLTLHDAVYYPYKIEEIEEIIFAKKCLLFEKDDDGRTPMHTLSIAGNKEGTQIAKFLIDFSENYYEDGKNTGRYKLLNSLDSKGFTALHYAARCWDPELVEALLTFGANPFLKDQKGNIALHYAAAGNSDSAEECVRKFLKFRFQVVIMLEVVNVDGLTPLDVASKNQSTKVINLFKITKLKYDIFHRPLYSKL